MRLGIEFYNKGALDLAKDLLGKVIVRNIDGQILKARITETEAYIGAIDKASHAYGGKITERTKPLYGKAGTVYVYFVYGMHYCFNIISGNEGEAEGVLIRGVEPIEGIEVMSINRYNKPFSELNSYQKKNITNGPAKVCKALRIDKSNNYEDLNKSDTMYLIDDNKNTQYKIKESKRIGIDYAEEAKDFLWRFYI